MHTRSTIQLLSGNPMPLLGLGTWLLTANTAETVAYALQVGYRMIDTSGDYGVQPAVGEGIMLAGIPRQRLFIVSKIEETDDAYEATRANLAELQLTYADLMLIHRPPEGSGASKTLWRGLIQAKQEGLARDIGVSNYAIDQVQALIDATGEVPAVNQIEWSPFGYSQEMLTFARSHGMIIQAYSPLTRTHRLQEQVVASIAQAHGKTPAQVLLRWNIQMGTVPIPKANNRAHLQENIAIFDFMLSDEEMDRLCGANERYSSLGTLPYL